MDELERLLGRLRHTCMCIHNPSQRDPSDLIYALCWCPFMLSSHLKNEYVHVVDTEQTGTVQSISPVIHTNTNQWPTLIQRFSDGGQRP